MAAKQAQRKRELITLACAALLCIALPLVAAKGLHHKVHVELADAASEALGIPVELGHASVGLTGTLEISEVRVADVFAADRVIASVSPTRIGPRRLAANELVVDSPRALVRVARDGSTNLDTLLAARRSSKKRSSGKAAPGKRSRLEQVSLVGGSLRLELEGYGLVTASDIDLRMRDAKIHGVFGKSEIQLHKDDWTLEGVMPRAAFDYERHGEGLQRVLAYGGALRLVGPRGRAMLQELMFSHQVGDEEWQLSARTGIDRPTGSILLQASPVLSGTRLRLEADNAPLALAGPWIPHQVAPQKARVSGTALVTRGADIAADLDLSFAKLEVDEKGFSKRPLLMDLDVDGALRVRETDGKHYLDAELRSLRSSDLDFSGSASGQWQGSALPELATIQLELAEVGCDAALNALPSGLRPMLAGLELRGRMQSRLEIMLSRSNLADTVLEVSPGIEGCSVVREPPAADTKALRASYEHRSPDGRPHLLEDGAPGFTPIKEMPSYVPRAFVAAEDARFFRHSGFDPHQIERSLAIDMQQGRFVRGGSTISQQLIKNLFLHRKRTLARKLQEAALTWRLEKNVKKERILEIYLNIIEFGDQNTYGITEAAERWFGVEPKELTILQTAFLAAIVPEPTSMSARIRDAQGLDAVSAGRVATILRAMKRGKVISKAEYQRARKQTLRFANGAVALRSQP
jgi:hypothetical protein